MRGAKCSWKKSRAARRTGSSDILSLFLLFLWEMDLLRRLFVVEEEDEEAEDVDGGEKRNKKICRQEY